MPEKTQNDRPRLLLLDGHSLAYRAFFALPVENFSTTTGQPTNAVYGFTSMLINVLRDESPTHVAVAFDLSRQSFRTTVFPEYKANRSESPQDFKGQVALTEEVLRALNIPVVTAVNYEADDVIATLATQAEAKGFDVLICTGDRDAYQLVSERVTVLYPKKGVSDLARMTPAAVEEKYGLTPAQYPDFAALRGDPSDNLPSIPGVGEKTATKWVATYGSLSALVEHADEITGKAGDALRAALASVMTNRELTQLVRDLALPVGIDDLERRDWDREAVNEVFDTLQFRVLRDRLYATLDADDAAVDAAPSAEFERPAPNTLGAWLDAHARSGRTGMSFRGRWGRGGGDLDALAMACEDGSAAVVAVQGLGVDDERALASWLADPTSSKAAHDVKGPMLALAARGLELAGVSIDTALAAYIALPGQRSFDLTDLSLRYLNRELATVGAESGQLSFDGADEDAADEADVIAAIAVRDLAGALDTYLEQRAARSLLSELELPLVGVLFEMERVGIAVDVGHLERLRDGYAREVQLATEMAHDSVGHDFNLGSPKQLQVVLFEELGLPKTKKIKTGYTTDAEALQWLAETNPHPVLDALLRHRDVTRLRTVVDGLLAVVSAEGRIHTTFQQMVAATGRLSSADPNVQNIPIRTAEGRQIREAFIVGEGYETLLTADYSQIEMRILAHLSADPLVIAAFQAGEDLHTTTASRVFEVEPGEVTADMRRRIKAMSYGLAYGLSAFGLSQQLKISTAEANQQMETYFETFGGVRDYLRAVVDNARVTGYTETIMGRRRYLPDLTSDNPQRRQMAERMALNAPIQGSAADVIKVAMLKVDAAIKEQKLASRLLLQVHDELVLEVAEGELDAVTELVRTQMAAAADLAVPLEVSIGIGHSWDAAAH